MIQSRCGLLCNKCKYREEKNCLGCVKIEKPFWGKTCPVKSCCEDKKLAHCGKCSEFPCNMLRQFSYDKEDGDNGMRLEQCKYWAGKKSIVKEAND